MNIVITGGNKGIGKAIGEKFAKEGHNAYLIARNKADLATAAYEIREKHDNINVAWYSADLSLKESSVKVAGWLNELNVKPDILINNAGYFIPGSIYNEVDGILEKMISHNLYSAYYVTRALLPAMIQKKSGHIFNMCSVASLHSYSNGGSYSISKFALRGFSQNLREELKPFNIKVSAVFPGAVMTDSWKKSDIRPGRIMTVEDIAALIYTAATLSPQACVEDIVIRPQLGDLP
jgi:short-subunit dehydrogenase